MTTNIPSSASAVIIGGGVIGSSIAYHLAELGWKNVVLLERKQFSCGTTWHAAGLIGTMRASENHAKLAEYSMSILHEIEKETGQSTGFKQVGSISVAHSEARFEELKRVASMNNAFGVTQVDVLSPDEAKELYPLLETADLLGATWVPQDGYASPIDVTAAFVKGARARGAICLEDIKAIDIQVENGKVCGVITNRGDIQSDYVVNCAGMWAREVGRMAGVNIPLHACEHYYAVTEKLDISLDLPVLRDHDRCTYYKPDAGSMLVGQFEPNAIPWGQKGIPDDFCFEELDGHFEDQVMDVLEKSLPRVPILLEAGWRKFFCGPESFTPDDQFHIGEAPEVKNFFVAAGLNSIGIQSAGGVGKALSEWMHLGHAPMDLWSNDIRRMYRFQGTQRYIESRVSETLGLLYDNHWPYRQMQTSRNVRLSPIHEKLVEHHACFGETAGWERPNWFAPEGIEPVYKYSFGKQNWFEYSASEHMAFRTGVALFDQSTFSKYLIQGRDSCAVLQRICSADIDVPKDRIVYTHWLNERGGIEADLTVTRLDEDRFLIVSAAAVTNRDLDWLSRNITSDVFCTVTDITNAQAVLGVMGPNSRDLLSDVLNICLDTSEFPFGTSREVEIGCAVGRASRVSYVGELGWEIYLPTDMARHGFDIIWEAGQSHDLKLAGLHALDSGRIEKKFLHFGHDISDEETPLECGYSFVCNVDKDIPFIGRDAILKQQESGTWKSKRLVQFLLEDPDAMLYHHEPILQNGKTVGHLTSGNYGHFLGGSVGLGYVHSKEAINKDLVESATFEIDVAGERIPATASLTAMYDPKALRMRA